MTLIFFSEHCKFHLDSKNVSKTKQKFDLFLENLICIGNRKYSLLLREYSKFAVNVLSSSPQILDPIGNNFF